MHIVQYKKARRELNQLYEKNLENILNVLSVTSFKKKQAREGTYGNKKVWHSPGVLIPGFTICLATTCNITLCTVKDHAKEENRIEPRKRAIKPCYQTPRNREEHIATIMNLARLAIPTINQNLVSLLCRDGLWVMNLSVFEVGECCALFDDATFFLPELVLLAVGCVPNIVDAKISGD